MQHAQTVVFGGSGLDRAAHLRGRDDVMAKALAGGAPVLPVWRGKPLIAGSPGDGPMLLAFRDMDHPVLAEAAEAPVLLGRRADGTLVFAADVSDWVPSDVDEAQVGAFIDRSVQMHPSEAESGAGFAELRGIMATLSPAMRSLRRPRGAFCSGMRRTRIARGAVMRACPMKPGGGGGVRTAVPCISRAPIPWSSC
jgi:NAD+ diphosphatase